MQSNNSKTYELVLTALFVAIIGVLAFTPLGFIPLGVINATTIHIAVIIGAIFLGPKNGAILGFVFGFTSAWKSTHTPGASSFVFSPAVALDTFQHDGIIEAAVIALRSIAVTFIPRILIGVVAYYVFVGVRKLVKESTKMISGTILNIIVSSLIGFGIYECINVNIKSLSVIIAGVIGAILGIVAFVLIEYLLTKKDAKAISFITAGIVGSMTNTILVMGGIFILFKESYATANNLAVDTLLSVIGGIISLNGVIEAVVAAIIVELVGTVLDKIKPAGVYSGKETKIKAVTPTATEEKLAQ